MWNSEVSLKSSDDEAWDNGAANSLPLCHCSDSALGGGASPNL